MTKGFVFGKFLPFHNGHKALIEFARQNVDYLEVLVCKSDQEKLAGSIRQKWIEETFNQHTNLKVSVFEYNEKDFPNTSISSEEVSRIWVTIFTTFFKDFDYVITSEKYGDYIAQMMDITHLCFDSHRKTIPISATRIKSNLVEYWDYLPIAVKKYYAKKVVIFGTESTGKTTLTKQLAQHFSCPYVLEAGRDIIENSNSFAISDLYKVLEEHNRRVLEATTEIPFLTIIDTDYFTTMSYADFFFNHTLEISNQYQKADLYLYLTNDVPFVQDGTRLDENTRNHLDLNHQKILTTNQLNYSVIDGDYEVRYNNAIRYIQELVDSHKIQLM